MKLEYIKANGITYKPQKAGVKEPNANHGNIPVCIIKKLMFNRWRVDYFDMQTHFNQERHYTLGSNAEDKPNQRIIFSLSEIQEIKYLI